MTIKCMSLKKLLPKAIEATTEFIEEQKKVLNTVVGAVFLGVECTNLQGHNTISEEEILHFRSSVISCSSFWML